MITKEKLREITEKTLLIQKILREPEEEEGAEEEDTEEEQDAEDEDNFYYDHLYISEAGKKYYNQIQEYMEFAIRGVVFTEMSNLFSIAKKVISNPYINEQIEKGSSDEKNKEIWDIIKSFNETGEIDNVFNPDGHFKPEDRSKFLGSLVFAIYSFSEVFVDELVEEAFTLPKFGEKYIAYLEKKRGKVDLITTADLEDYDHSRNNYLQKKAKQLFREYVNRNPYDKQITIINGIGIRDTLHGIFEELGEKNYIQEFYNLKELRNRIAHGTPTPSIDSFDSPELEKQVEETNFTMQKGTEPQLNGILNDFQMHIQPIIKPSLIIQEIVENGIILPAILDRVITEIKNQEV